MRFINVLFYIHLPPTKKKNLALPLTAKLDCVLNCNSWWIAQLLHNKPVHSDHCSVYWIRAFSSEFLRQMSHKSTNYWQFLSNTTDLIISTFQQYFFSSCNTFLICNPRFDKEISSSSLKLENITVHQQWMHSLRFKTNKEK